MKKLLTVTAFSALLTFLKMATGFLIAKVVAIYAGPSGVAMLGQLQSIVSCLNGLAMSPSGSGIVRFTAENQAQGYEACSPWWRASLRWTLVLAAVLIPISCLLSAKLSVWFFGNNEYAWLIVISAFFMPLAGLGNLVNSISNGLHQYRRCILIGMVAVIVSTSIMLVMIVKKELLGALIVTAIQWGVSGVVWIFSALRQPWFKWKYFASKTEVAHFRAIGGYILMAISSAIMLPTSLLIIRTILIDDGNWELAGQWQSVWRISEAYLSVITMSLSVYYLPKLSSLTGIAVLRQEIHRTAILIMPIVIAMALMVYFARDIIITVLYTEAFRSSRDLFAIQLAGDVVKIMAWLYSYPMVSRGAVKWFISTEIVFSVTFVLLSFIFVPRMSASGVNLAYLINYIFYFLFLFISFNKYAK